MPRTLLLNHALLFLLCSICLGSGVWLVCFEFPLGALLTGGNYPLIFGQPVANATRFFTYVTIVMAICATVMLITEWFSGLRWPPVIVWLAILATIALFLLVIVPLNKELAASLTNSARLRIVFHQWANWVLLLVLLWAVQWLAMMYWFYRLAFQARADR